MKRTLIYSVCSLFCCLLFLYSPNASEAARDGFILWRDYILPSLLPFCVLTYIMRRTGVPAKLERVAMVAMCLISGAPSGAQLAGNAQNTDSRTVALLNLVSPMFIYGSFCSGMLGNPGLAVPILIAQFGTLCLLLPLFPPTLIPSPDHSPPSIAVLSEALSKAMPSMLNICASIIFFMAVSRAAIDAIISMTNLPANGFLSMLVSGIIEMSGGCGALAKMHFPPRLTAACAAFFFSFGGLCVFVQSLTFCPIQPLKYLSIKLLQGLLAAAIAFLITPLFPAAGQPVFHTVSPDLLLHNAISFGLSAGVSLIAMSVVLMTGAAARYGRKNHCRSEKFR